MTAPEWHKGSDAPKDGTAILAEWDGIYGVIWWKGDEWWQEGHEDAFAVSEPGHWMHIPRELIPTPPRPEA